MAEKDDLAAGIAALTKADPGYRREAYLLIFEAIAFAHGRQERRDHLSAAELVHAMLDYARKEYGPMAAGVLSDLGVVSPREVGALVYKLIAAGLLFASPADSPDDFNAVTEWLPPVPSAGRHTRQLPKID